MISIDVGASRICVCETTGKGRNLSVSSVKIIPVDREIITDANIVFNECFAEYMELALSDCSDKDVAISFSMLPIISNDYTIPYSANKRVMEGMVKGKVFQTLSESDYIADYTIGDIFKQDSAKLCTVSTYVAPRAIVKGTFEIIKNLGKNPKSYRITQDGALSYAKTFLEDKTIIIAYLASNQIMLHLINQPDKIITRNTSLSDEGGLDVLGALGSSQDTSILQQGYSQISKLVQYQAIKYPDVAVETIYIVGECADDEMVRFLNENLTPNVEFLPGVSSNTSSKKDIGICFYAVCIAI